MLTTLSVIKVSTTDVANLGSIRINSIDDSDENIVIKGYLLIPESSSFYKNYKVKYLDGEAYLKINLGRLSILKSKKTSSFEITIRKTNSFNRLILIDKQNRQKTIWEK